MPLCVCPCMCVVTKCIFHKSTLSMNCVYEWMIFLFLLVYRLSFLPLAFLPGFVFQVFSTDISFFFYFYFPKNWLYVQISTILVMKLFFFLLSRKKNLCIFENACWARNRQIFPFRFYYYRQQNKNVFFFIFGYMMMTLSLCLDVCVSVRALCDKLFKWL